MSRHLELCHAKEIEIAKVLALKKGSTDRRNAFSEITRVGDYYHNCETLANRKGELILLRRPNKNEIINIKYTDYIPCPHCLGFLLKKHLWSHVKYNCSVKKQGKFIHKEKDVMDQSMALISHTRGKEVSKHFEEFILRTLRKNDPAREKVLTDPLILHYGTFLYEKFRNSKTDLIRQAMRRLGRLMTSFPNGEANNVSCLLDAIMPQNFDRLVEAVTKLCVVEESNNERPTLGIPSLALKLGNSLRKCASIQRGICLKKGDLKTDQKMQAFLSLMDIEYSDRVSSMALSSLKQMKLNKVELLPLTSDLKKLNSHLEKQMEKYKTNLIESPSDAKAWKGLALATLSRIIVFNKKRSGEVAKMKIKDFTSIEKWKEQNREDLISSLSPLEKRLAASLGLFYIAGKRGNNVPVLLTPSMKLCLEKLIACRNGIEEIREKNDYLFARFNSDLYIRGHEALNFQSKNAGLEKPELIKATKLRKYVATVTQVLNLSENESDWLARHLGHDIRVHRDFYRMQESAVELTKVSRLLLAVDEGNLNQFAGRGLADIDVQDLPPVYVAPIDEDACSSNPDDDDNNNSENEGVEEEDNYNNNNNNGEDDINHHDSDDTDHEYNLRVTGGKRKKKYDDDLYQGGNPTTSRKTVSQNRSSEKEEVRKNGRTYWSERDKMIVLKDFKLNILRQTTPGKEKCEEFLKKNISIKRSWQDVKWCVYNEISKLKRKRTT